MIKALENHQEALPPVYPRYVSVVLSGQRHLIGQVFTIIELKELYDESENDISFDDWIAPMTINLNDIPKRHFSYGVTESMGQSDEFSSMHLMQLDAVTINWIY